MKVGARRGVAVVTGASAGVGRATAVRLAEVGFDVGLIARSRAGLEDAARQIAARGADAMILPCDVSDAVAIDAAADRVAERWGRIDVWVNCAMATVFSRFVDVTPDEYRRVTDVTYHGQVFGTRAALRHMRRRNAGTIVQVGSALAYRAIPLQSAYCGAKHAIVGFTESLRTELMHENSAISVSMVHLPAVNTPQFVWSRRHLPAQPRPAGPPIRPEVAARVIADAALNPRREIYLGWGTITAILGNMALPAYGDIEAEKAWEGQLVDGTRSAQEGNLFAPVETVPRDRGPFRTETKDSAISVSGLGARLALAGVGALALAAFGGLAFAGGRRSARRQEALPRQ